MLIKNDGCKEVYFNQLGYAQKCTTEFHCLNASLNGIIFDPVMEKDYTVCEGGFCKYIIYL